jgi:hypothetical protein
LFSTIKNGKNGWTQQACSNMDDDVKRAFAEAKCMVHGKRGQKLRTEINHVLIGKYIQIEMARMTALWELCLQCCPHARKPKLADIKADAVKRFKVTMRTVDKAWAWTSLHKRPSKGDEGKIVA